MDSAGVRVEKVTKSYPNGFAALKQIDLEIRPGELVVLVGPSGCGKSTLLRTVAGLEALTSGNIYIGERNVTDDPPGDRGIAMVFQDYALYPHMSVRENLAFGLRMRKLEKSEIEKRIAETATLLGIEKFLARKPAELSGGQRQRVAIGRAIVKQPRVFLFDEPLSNLDAQLRLRMRTEIGALHRRLGATTLYVTHDQAEAMTLAERLVIMKAGEIVQQGSPLEIYHRPANRFVASFIGSPEMNLFEGVLGTEAGHAIFIHQGDAIKLPRALAPTLTGKVVLGFRPEAVFVTRDPASAAFSARTVRVESHGHETHLVAELAGTPLVLRSSQPSIMNELAALQPGQLAYFRVKPEGLHWFEAQSSGARIATAAAAAA